jgi:predicted CDP-diglyceride synthetase/phosphatidate cytidylyltransferase
LFSPIINPVSETFRALSARIPQIDLALVAAACIAGLLSLLSRRRGGRFRELPGWAGFWAFATLVLISLSHAPRWVSFPILAALMFAAQRTYFFVAPVRPRDRYAILASYLAVPFALWPAYLGSEDLFVAVIPVSLFLVIPVFLAIGPPEKGMLDSMGRTLLGVLLFVFCLAHLGLLAHDAHRGVLELYGILVLAAETPQRLAGRFRTGTGWWIKPTLGIPISLLLAISLGFVLGPWAGLDKEDAARAGLLVVIAVTMGALVNQALAEDLSLTHPSARRGRGALLDRIMPAAYAAPVYFHYLNHFAP